MVDATNCTVWSGDRTAKILKTGSLGTSGNKCQVKIRWFEDQGWSFPSPGKFIVIEKDISYMELEQKIKEMM